MRGIPFVVHNPIVALSILLAWALMALIFARRYPLSAPDPASEDIVWGPVFVAAAVVFDVMIVAGIARQGLRHFAQLVLWISYYDDLQGGVS